MQLALQQLHAMFLFALFAARSLFTLRSALSLCKSRFPWSAMIRHFRKLAARQLQLALFFFFSVSSFLHISLPALRNDDAALSHASTRL